MLDVGQCALDHGNIRRLLTDGWSARVEQATTIEQALAAVRADHYDLVLVNRILDAEAAEGMELIRRLREDERTRGVAVMLVSNYADAQDQAVALGAKPGFGKNALTSPLTKHQLASILGPTVPRDL